MPTATPPADTFRIPFWRMYPGAVVYAQAGYTPLVWAQLFLLAPGRPRPFPLTEYVILYIVGSLLLTVILAPAFWVYVRKLVVRVSPDGFTCSNGFGKLVTVPWGSITGVRKLHVPGFPYLLVGRTKTRLKLWLPLFLGRLPEFAERVELYAGPEHPLYQAVWRSAEWRMG